MDFILANYDTILIAIVVTISIGYGLLRFLTQPSTKQKEQIKAILLNLVIYAEEQFGSSTGKLKFSYVYSELVIKLPYLRFIPMNVIEQLVNESLEEMRHLLETNKEIARIVHKEGEE